MALRANTSVELIIGTRQVRTRVLRCLGKDVYLDALPEIEAELTPAPGEIIEMVWVDDDMRWRQAVRMVDVLETLPIMLVNLIDRPKTADQRRMPRTRVTVPVEYGVPRRERYLTTTLDLSASGLRFPSAVPLWEGLDLALILRLGTDVVETRATVVRVDRQPRDFRGRQGWETAVRFVRLGRAERATLEAFVLRHLDTGAPRTRRRSSITKGGET